MSEKDQPHDETQPVRPQGTPADQPDAASPGVAASSADAPDARPADPGAAPLPPAAGHPYPAGAYVPPAAPPGAGWGRARRWRDQARGDRAYGLGALVASALAGVIIGGVGTAVFHAVTDDHAPGDRFGRFGPMGDRDGDRDGGRGPMFGGPGVPGQLQPTTPPEDDDSGSSS